MSLVRRLFLGLFSSLAITVLCSQTVSAQRIWTNATGEFKVEAELVDVADGVVVLQRTDGRIIKVPVTKLSKTDRDFVTRLLSPADVKPPVTTPPVVQPTPEPQDSNVSEEGGEVRYGATGETIITCGAKLSSQRGARGLSVSLAVPAVWPEQEVEIIEVTKPSSVSRIGYRDVPGGSKQMLFTANAIPPGGEALVEVKFRVTRKQMLPPANPGALRSPKPAAALRPFLQSSPGIELRHETIQKTAADLKSKNQGGWSLAEATFDWVRDNLKYVGGDLRGALWAAQHGQGDCEEFTSLYIALCRANGIPARAVWVPGHCYPEFYLEDSKGRGHWFACDTLAETTFGKLSSTAPILQKGDSFRVSGHPKPIRYLQTTLTGRDGQAAILDVLRVEE